MINLFEHEEKAHLFIDQVIGKYKRYARDQFMVLEKSILEYPEEREAALEHCIKNKLWSANDFRDISVYLSQNRLIAIPKAIESASPKPSTGISVSTRSINEYVKIMGGEPNE